jgi:isoleucyl-tRNA synthetase
MFDPVSNKVDFARQEEDVLAFWKSRDIFRQSIEQRRDRPEFVFYDGPPFATGLPHYGHLLAGTIKDIIPRYQTMRGHRVERRFGWDCHGLPVEYEMEQELNISGKRDIEALGVDVFNEKCRSIVLRYTEEWREIVTRMGRWVDFDHDYKTMDLSYMESIWWVFKALWDQGLIYEGQKILPYCPRCATPLSNFETNQGYQDVRDPAVTVRFALEDEPGTYVLAWTTTPWTLPSNLALAVGAEVTYVKVQDGDERYIMARDRLGAYYKNESDYQVLEELPGAALAGKRYTPLFPYFVELREQGAFRVHTAEFVTTEDGTGVVHIAPGFGEDDYQLGQRAGLPVVCPVDDEGRFTAEVADYVGEEVKQADAAIIKRLKQEGKLVHQGVIDHSYPHCWRCDAPLIYRGVSTWFVKVESLRDRLVKHNQSVHWVPGHLRDGRFGKWLEQARDWAISRNRYWGAPLPVWQSEDGKERVCVGSVEELERLTGETVTDLHKHFVDRLEIPSPSGGAPLKRVPQVLDCWFESGAMPFAQVHYPFENKEWFDAHFPADFIAEGLDQTRGWFYTLMILAAALKDRPAFRNVVVNGLVLAEDGRKMSKRLKNYPDPVEMVHQYGADALRLYLIASPVVRAEDLCFSEEGVKHALRHLLIPWWNAYSFFVTYANIDGWQPGAADAAASPHLLDRWILSALERLNGEVEAAMDGYDLQAAVRPFVRFVEDLTNWYIRRSRRRFWKSTDDQDKQFAYATLYEVLVRLSQIAAPFVPFVSESIYRNLRREEMPESVHLCDFPTPAEARRDLALEQQMETVMTVVGLGRQLRASYNVKVRQPLSVIHVVCRNDAHLDQVAALKDIIREELNVHDVAFSGDETGMADLRVKPNFKTLGPRLGADMKRAPGWIAAMPAEQVMALLDGASVELAIEGREPLVLSSDDVVIERVPKEGLAVATEGAIVVGLDLTLTEALVAEGLAREFVNKVQQMRKTAEFEVTQRIRVRYAAGEPVQMAIGAHVQYIAQETLAVDVEVATGLADGVDWELNGHAARIDVQPVEA